MRVKDVKVCKEYLYQGLIRSVIKRIKTKVKHGENVTRFELHTGEIVFASELEKRQLNE